MVIFQLDIWNGTSIIAGLYVLEKKKSMFKVQGWNQWKFIAFFKEAYKIF